MNKKHSLMFLLLSFILLSLSCVNADNETFSDISNENILNNPDSTEYNENHDITKNPQDSVKEDNSQSHYISTSDELTNILSTTEDLTGKHIIELNHKELIINKDFYIFNDDLELIFNGNGNQLTLQNNLAFSVKNVTFNNLIMEFDDNLESYGGIDNYGNMNLNNVTIKNTKEYEKMINIFKENGYYDFNDYNCVKNTFDYSTRGMNLNNKGILYVNNSHFINNSGHSGSSIYNDGKINVENTVFQDSIGKYGIIYSINDTVIKNCEFKNNRVLQQLILNQENSELINTTFTNNIIAGSAILDNRGSLKTTDCKFANNTAKYAFVDNWVYMEASNLNLCNNTCEILINSFGNLTLKDSFIKDNTCSRAIICRDTLYHNITTHEIDKAGNVTLIGNKIFRGNVDYKDFFNNQDTGVISLYNNTIYDNPDYAGDCIFDGNIFVANKNLYDDEGNYHGQTREMKIWQYMNYEIVEKEYQGAKLTIYGIETLYVNETTEISGYLIDKNNKAIADKEVFLSITDPEYITTFFNPITNTDGTFSVDYTPTIPGNYVVNSFYESDDQYDTATYDTEFIVLQRPIDTTPNDTIDNNTIENENTENESQNDENPILDNITNTNDDTNKNINTKSHHKTIKTHITQKILFNKSFNKKLSDKIILKLDMNVTLSWLNDIFKDDFKNKTLLIYIDDILVFNSTTSDNPSEILFKVLEEYYGEHTLKIIADNNTYQKIVNII